VSNDLRILTGNAHPALARSICGHLGLPLSEATVKPFSNENIFVQLKESVRSKDVYIVQPFSSPVSNNIMELLIMLDTCKRASAGRITAVIPYFAYGRTDKKDQPRVPITARLLADLITVAGANRVIMIDLHAEQIQGFFSIPVDELVALPLLAHFFKERAGDPDPEKRLDLCNVVVVSPDIGAAKRARDFAARLCIDNQFAIINKRRDPSTSKVEALNVIGDVADQTAILIDEEINTGGSILAAAHALKAAKAKDIYVCATHAVFSGDFRRNLTAFPFKEIVVTDTLPLSLDKQIDGLSVVSVAPFLGDVIASTHEGDSLGKMLREKYA
jgi:ribose-phosphate pyrophosphokinase